MLFMRHSGGHLGMLPGKQQRDSDKRNHRIHVTSDHIVGPGIVQGSSQNVILNLESFQVVRWSVLGGTFGIGEAARRAGVSPDLVRYYERVGVLPRAPRTAGGFRYYSDDTVARLLFVRNAIRFGFTSKELAGFLKARDSGRPPCHSVRAAGQRLLNEMDDHLVRLHEAREAMAETLAAWDARLERTAAGTPAHLLTMVPDAPRPTRRGVAPKHRTP
jgi:DNA-binding transcriptional MerR regulator